MKFTDVLSDHIKMSDKTTTQNSKSQTVGQADSKTLPQSRKHRGDDLSVVDLGVSVSLAVLLVLVLWACAGTNPAEVLPNFLHALSLSFSPG